MTDLDIDIDIEWKRGRSPAAFASKMALFEKRLDSELEQAMQQSVLWVERDAKQFAPVGETGNLRASIASTVEGTVKDEIRGYIGSNIKYAPFPGVRHGTYGCKPVLAASDREKPRPDTQAV
jgi:hypothetical protein